MPISVDFPNFLSILIIGDVIGSIILTIANILIIKSGRNQPIETKSANLLIYAGLINIVLEILRYIVPYLSISDFTEIELQFFFGYLIFKGLLFSVPYLFTFGLTFLIFGRRNRETFGSYLLIAGTILIISNGLNIVFLDGELFNYFFVILGVNLTLVGFLVVFSMIIVVLNTTAFLLLIRLGYKNNDNYLFFAGITAIGSLFVRILIGFFITFILIILTVNLPLTP